MARTARKRYTRHSQYDRLERSRRLRAFISARAEDLEGTGAATAFTVTDEVIASTAHGHSLGDGPFLVAADGDGVLPAPLTDDQFYWIASATENAFTLTTRRGGAAITLLDSGDVGEGTGFSIVKAESDSAIYEYLRQNGFEAVRDADDVDDL